MKKHKLLAVLLVLAMTLSLLPTAALAEETVPQSDYVECITEGGNVDAENKTVTYPADASIAVKWYPSDPTIYRFNDGWWIGIKVWAPATEGFVLTSAKFQTYGSGGWSADKSFNQCKDSTASAARHFITLWGQLTPEYLINAKSNETNLTYKWQFSWDGDDTFESLYTLVINPNNVTLTDQSGHEVYPSNTDSEFTASVGGTLFSTITAAVGAAGSNATIVLLKDTAEDIKIPAEKTLTLDLNGKTLSNLETHSTVSNEGALIIKDSSAAGTGKITNSAAGKPTLKNKAGTVTINGGTLEKTNDYYVIENHGEKVTINSGVITSSSSNASAIENGWYTPSENTGEAYSTMEINGGEVSNTGVTANGGLYTVKNDDYGIMIINGGTFTNTVPQAGTVLNWNDLTINDGIFNATGAAVRTLRYGTLDYEIGKTQITGGDFTGTIDTLDSYAEGISVSITGGTFSDEPASDYVASGYHAGTVGGECTVHAIHAETDAAVDPTCTATGLTEGSHCSVCQETLVAQTVILATGHTAVDDAAEEPTCTTDGKTAGSHCSVCQEILVAQGVVPATGHSFGEWITTQEPTATEDGSAKRVCSVCGHEETKTLPALGVTTYTITPSVTNGTITPSEAVEVAENGSQRFDFAPNDGYELLSVKVDGSDMDATSYYEFTNVTADHTIVVAFTEKAPETMQVDFQVTPTNATIVVKDAKGGEIAANQYGGYDLVIGKTYTYTVSASGYVSQSGSFVPSLTAAGGNLVTVALVPQSSGGSSGGGGSSSGGSSSSSTTEKNPDGSTTTTTTDKTTGTVTEVTKETDGTTTTVETKKDGTVTETVKTPDGTTGTVVTDKNGDVTEAKATVSSTAAKAAEKADEAVTLPVEVPAAKTTEDAPAVQVTVPKSAGSVKVEIPVEKVTPGTVAVIVNADGTEKIVSTSVVTENGVALTLDGSATVKVIDNSKTFTDVPETNVFYNEISSLSAREIMVGKTNDKFDLYSSVTLNQIANVAGRITGAVDVSDYAGGIAWGEANGLKTGDTAATRGEVLKALYIAAGSPAVEDTSILNSFNDASSIPADMADIVAWAAQNGILKGTDAGNADLGVNVTRGQACALAGRAMGTLA